MILIPSLNTEANNNVHESRNDSVSKNIITEN
jgi:hypothetical protein